MRVITVSFLFYLFSAGCRGDAITRGDGGPTDPTVTPGDTDVGPTGYPRPCSDIYNPSVLQTFDVVISDTEWSAMRRDCEEVVQRYRPIELRYGAETVSAMIRLKGNWSWNCDKMQFVISFNEVDPDGRFHGQRKIVLDAPWYDPTLLHERLAFFFMERYGTAYSCVNHARLNINGAYYGIYANVERIDREYLERHFDLPDGNLYKEGRELTTNEETADTSRMEAYWDADDLSTLEGLVDLEQAIGVWAGLAMVPDPDSYWAGVEINFYLYDHPSRGFLYLPYDMDIAFAENIWPDLASADPITYEHEEWLREPQYEMVLSDSVWCGRFVEALRRARSAYDAALFQSKIDEWIAQIGDAISDDPNKTFDMAEHREALEALRQFPGRRAAFVDAWLTSDHCPPEWSTAGRP